MRWIAAGIVSLLLGAPAHAAAAPRDLHDYWDTRCKSCHGDAGAFARRTLRVDHGRLLGWHHENDLDLFLAHHYLTADLVAPVKAMLAAQVETPPLFAQRCAGCHGSAAAFARASLALQGGVLVGRAKGRPVADTLRDHGGLAPAEIAPLVKTLERVLAEVGGAARAP